MSTGLPTGASTFADDSLAIHRCRELSEHCVTRQQLSGMDCRLLNSDVPHDKAGAPRAFDIDPDQTGDELHEVSHLAKAQPPSVHGSLVRSTSGRDRCSARQIGLNLRGRSVDQVAVHLTGHAVAKGLFELRMQCTR